MVVFDGSTRLGRTGTVTVELPSEFPVEFPLWKYVGIGATVKSSSSSREIVGRLLSESGESFGRTTLRFWDVGVFKRGNIASSKSA